MKKIIAFVLVFVSINAAAQNIAVTDSVIKFGITPKGKSNGIKRELKIDKEGGNIQSPDGKVELIFPAGAVTKKTNISIQPVTNYAPNSNGNAYQMEPSGINFKQPVQIIIHYRNEDTEGSTAALLGIAMQNDEGLWSSLQNVAVDTVLKKVSATISHFSFYVNYVKAKINPPSAKLKVNNTMRLTVTHITEGTEDDELTPLGNQINGPVEWCANGVPHGDNINGIVSPSQHFTAVYKAPASVPDNNPVAVSVEFKNTSANTGGKSYNSLRLASRILIYGDAWEVKMVTSMKGGSPLAWGGVVTYDDEGSFVVSMNNNKGSILSINNKLETITDNCEKIILNPATCTGMIHIVGLKYINVTPAQLSGSQYPVIEIAFIQRRAEFTQIKYTCPPPPGSILGTSRTTNFGGLGMLMSIPAQPVFLKFKAKDGEQVIEERGTPGSELYYKIWVTKVTEQ